MSEATPLVVVVDDEPERIHLVRLILQDSYSVRGFESAREALRQMDPQETDLLLSDMRMPEMSGLELLDAIKAKDSDLAIVLMTSHGTVPQAVECIKRGAYDYLMTTFEPDALTTLTHRAVEHTRLSRKARHLQSQLERRDALEDLLGQSSAMRSVLGLLERVRTSDITVLVTGESGTGKERVARILHQSSLRSARPFVPINCGAIPADLLESELFGHVRGAFTGAVDLKRGLVDQADGGTLFLDEIGDLPLDLQVKLNRFLQEGEVRRVGSVDGHRVDVRIVAATHRDLEADARAGRFRWDLFYRINTFPVHLPPLRERSDDIPLLAQLFLRSRAEREGRSIDAFDPAALGALCRYHWPGNVRELESAVARAVVLAPGSRITLDCLPVSLRGSSTPAPARSSFEGLTFREAQQNASNEAARAYLSALMTRHAGNVSRAASAAGMERETLHRLLRQHHVAAAEFRKAVES